MRAARAKLKARATGDGESLRERRRRAGKRPRPKKVAPAPMPPALATEDEGWSHDTREAFRRVKQLVPAGELVPAHLVFAESIRIRDARGDGYDPGEVPNWLQEWVKEASKDADLAELVDGAENNPSEVEQRIIAKMKKDFEEKFGEDEGGDWDDLVKVQFRDVDNFSLWVWWELEEMPGTTEKEALEEVVKSWFLLGRLGAYNSMNLQVYERQEEVSYFNYSGRAAKEAPSSLFHSMSDFEYKGKWARCWFDLGTADEIALDVLINTLNGMLEHMIPIKQVIFGGENADWKINPKMMKDAIFEPGSTYTNGDYVDTLGLDEESADESGEFYEMDIDGAQEDSNSLDDSYNIEDYL